MGFHHSTLITLRRMAPIVYKSEGQRLAKSVFEETMDELSFAGVKEIIAGVSKG